MSCSCMLYGAGALLYYMLLGFHPLAEIDLPCQIIFETVLVIVITHGVHYGKSDHESSICDVGTFPRVLRDAGIRT